jgi:CRISPR-associated endonuclease/helicase Cas3
MADANGDNTVYYARSVNCRPKSEWQVLDGGPESHLQGVSDRAAAFGAAFESADWGRIAGLWHDLGKYRDEFQKYLEKAKGATGGDHAVVGALLASLSQANAGLPLALAIAGHHAGVANPVESGAALPTPLKERLQKHASTLKELLPRIPDAIKNLKLPPMPERFRTSAKNLSAKDRDELFRSLEFWTRFLFSALVDADRLDAEAFDSPDKRRVATAGYDTIAALRDRLDQHIDGLAAAKVRGADSSPVNRCRAAVLQACRQAAELPPGIFSLSVPTGGGKTLSAMAFALRHAERHGLRRIIAVIPYTSIIEQNAAVYRKALGDANVIEHHSNLDPATESERNQLASENWDAPVIVTTSVQFFESLFSNRPSACRKLHNVARSVIVLDEVQTLPPQFLSPILQGLQELVDHYGCTIVLSTATQPALARRESLPDGLVNVQRIIADPATLGRDLRRVAVEWPALDEPPVTWEGLAAELAKHRQVLAIVHRRDDARKLAELLMNQVPKDEIFHLSALMCPMHRSAVLDSVKETLEAGKPCRLVSTQLVEAGVDIDFPVVYRALGGLDSIVQAAGRCNREGKAEAGLVVVFRAPSLPPRGTATKGLKSTESMLRHTGGTLELDDPCIFEEFFRSLYFAHDLDARGIQAERTKLNFATVGRDFKLIEDGCHTVLVPYEGVQDRLAAFCEAVARREVGSTESLRVRLRALQPFLVNLYNDDFDRLMSHGAIDVSGETVHVLTLPFHHLYSKTFGLVVKEPLLPDPTSHVV